MSLLGTIVLLADLPQTQPNPTGQKIQFVLMMGIFLVIMWVLMIAPQRKKAKEQDAMMKALKAGDKIITASGIVGVVLSIKDKSLSIRSADTKLEILKSAVAEITDRGGETGETKS
jgi:preprotein translocase subunit YajC